MILICTWDGSDEGFNPNAYRRGVRATAAGRSFAER